jgi:hemoglobin
MATETWYAVALQLKPIWKTNIQMKCLEKSGHFFTIQMRDIQTREDLHLLMSEFYKKLLADSKINFIFTEVAKIDLEPHLLDLVDFWEQLLFDTGSYRKNVLQIHKDVNQKLKLSEEHFTIWLHYFNTTIDENFEGQIAENMKTRTLSIATVMKIKM